MRTMGKILFIFLLFNLGSLSWLFVGCTTTPPKTVKKEKLEKLLAHVDEGFIDTTGTVVISLTGRFHGKFSEGLARVWTTVKDSTGEHEKWGFVDATGKFIIPPTYDWAYPFSDSLAAVNIGGSAGMTTSIRGADLIWAPIEGGKWCYIDRNGKVALEVPYEGVDSFHDGLAPVKSKGKSGYIDKTGRLVVPLQYDIADEMSNGMGAVLAGHKWGFIDKSGKTVVAPKYSSRIELADGRIFMGIGFRNGLAWVDNGLDWRKGKKWGVIDSTGTFVIDPQFEQYGSDFIDGLSCVKIGKKNCVIDKSGKILLETAYDELYGFSDGKSSFKKGKKWGAIDRMGNVILQPQFDNPFSFFNGFAIVMKDQYDNEGHYIDSTGRWLFSGKKFRDPWEFQKVYYE